MVGCIRGCVGRDVRISIDRYFIIYLFHYLRLDAVHIHRDTPRTPLEANAHVLFGHLLAVGVGDDLHHVGGEVAE